MNNDWELQRTAGKSTKFRGRQGRVSVFIFVRLGYCFGYGFVALGWHSLSA
jgi:hypothetical protein